ncbi:ORC-CDC6 family AAA ATPase [Sphingobacterium multivorum]|uniref:ORC-CDC6 family AAA ATPase n=1 Tax=Sphingobacterium multivorum TaxID=28454 RepID=UPI003DA22F19
MLTDIKISKAISGISQRAERILDDNKVIKTYVEVGILPQISNPNNQIIYGRRGTGKTHLFRYLENEIKTESITVYVDCRTLGSASDYNDQNLPMNKRCISLFKDVIDELYDKALHFIMYDAPKDAEKALESLDNILEATRYKINNVTGKEIVERTIEKSNNETGLSLSINPTVLVDITLGDKETKGNDVERTTKYSVISGEKILFPDLNASLKALCNYTGAQIFFLFDEWSSLPFDLQPLFAEFLKRSFLPIPQVTIKIAALEYRSNFTIQQDKNNHIGFELGSDISTNLDLDDYYVFDRNPAAITTNFGEMLFKHVANELEDEYLIKTYGIKNGKDFIRTILTDSNNFKELVRASEGVIRDMINIFTLAFFDAQRQGREKIDKKSIVESSRQWFERDKAQNLDDHLSEILRKIVDEVIGNKRARSFLIPRELEKHDNIQKLFDARVIHFIKRGYADKDNPGVRYNVFGLDYGTYVDLITTNKKPEIDFLNVNDRNENDEFIVPFDDKRSIRRIILTETILS